MALLFQKPALSPLFHFTQALGFAFLAQTRIVFSGQAVFDGTGRPMTTPVPPLMAIFLSTVPFLK